MFEKNLINICERNLKRTSIVISIVLTLAAASSAQNINDDLKPKTVTPKKTTASTKTLAKSTKKVTKPVKRNPVQTGATKPKVVAPKTIYTETSDQIINRFMNYGQSASVTNRDWTSVINQSQKNLKANPNNVTANAQ
ncbi:MAG: hypothetical protein ABJA66_16770 [Actinomycetota bacterium]